MTGGSLESDTDIKRADHLLAKDKERRNAERWTFEQRQAQKANRLSWLTFVSTGLVGAAAAIVGCVQLWLAFSDDDRKSAQLELS